MAGRGSFTESFPLFGYSLRDYDELFAEKLDLLLALREDRPLTWSGRFRPPLEDAVVRPRPERPLPIWIAVGGTPQSVIRAGTLGLPLALAIIVASRPRSCRWRTSTARRWSTAATIPRHRWPCTATATCSTTRRRPPGLPARVPADLRQDRPGARLAADVGRRR